MRTKLKPKAVPRINDAKPRTKPPKDLDGICHLAAKACRAPVAFICMLGECELHVQAATGIEFESEAIPLEGSFCAYVLLDPQSVFIVEDARADIRFARNAKVTAKPHFRFYAGTSILSPSGKAIGTLGVHDYVPRSLSPAQLKSLRTLSRTCSLLLEDRDKAASSADSTFLGGANAKTMQLPESQPIVAALNRADVPIWTWDLDKGVIAYSRLMGPLFGRPAGFVHRSHNEFLKDVCPEDRGRVARTIRDNLARATDWQMEYRALGPDGCIRWISDAGVVFRDASGRALQLTGVLTDISRAKEAEFTLDCLGNALSAVTGEAFFRGLAAGCAKALRVSYVMACEYLDEKPSRARSLVFWSKDHLGDAFEFDLKNCPCAGVVAGGRLYFADHAAKEFPESVIVKDFKIRGYCGLTYFDRHGARIGHLCVFDDRPIDRDYSTLPAFRAFAARAGIELEGLRAQAALKASEARFCRLAESIPAMIWTCSAEGKLTYANAEWGRFVGVKDSGRLDVPLEEFFHPEDRLAWRKSFDGALARKEGCELDCRLRRFDGQYSWVFCRATPQFATDGTFLGLLASALDIQTRKTLEEQVSRTSRLASLGTLTAGIAHELNNPLGSILLATRMAESRLSSQEREGVVAECLRQIAEDAKRSGAIIRSLLRFSRKEKGEAQPHDLNDLVRRVRDISRSLAEAMKVRLVLENDGALPPVDLNPVEMEQALLNILNNAIEASIVGGVVRLRTECKEQTVSIIISDNGKGMTQEQAEHAFDPFYTTRRNLGGTGLGLTLAHMIVTEHSGTLEIRSRLAEGTTVIVRLPAVASAKGLL